MEQPIPSGCYVFRYVGGSYGYAKANEIKPLQEMSLQSALCGMNALKFKDQIQKDYKALCNNIPTNNIATTRSELIVNLYKRTQGADDFLEVVAGVKKRKLNTEDEDKDQIMTDGAISEEFIDPY